MNKLRVLVGCEESGIVREAFRSLGHDAWSCDLMPARDDSPFHIQGDVFEAIKSRTWDIGIFHPPCDYLTVSGNRWFSDSAKARPGILTGQARRDAQREAVVFVMKLWYCGIRKVCIENPQGRLSTLWRPPTQYVEPFHFGDPYRKRTGLWLKMLPCLLKTNDLGTGEQACWKMGPSDTRKRDRSVTYPGLAKAMADQWGNL